MARNKKSSSPLCLLFSAHSVNSVLKSPLAPSPTLALAVAFFSSTMLMSPVHAQDKTPPMTMAQQMQHHHGDVPLVAPVYYPRQSAAHNRRPPAIATRLPRLMLNRYSIALITPAASPPSICIRRLCDAPTATNTAR